MKETLFQSFQWYTRADGFLYSKLKKLAPRLKTLGVSMVWMPPAGKGLLGKKDTGYSVYDLYDLGEFHQKGSVRTKYGTVRQYQAAIAALHANGMSVIADIVFNHRMGGDSTETVRVRPMSDADRNKQTGPAFELPLHTKFTFDGRHGKYSEFVWNKTCFKATDRTEHGQRQILLFDGAKWDEHVSKEQGNFDFIMGMDVDLSKDWVKKELTDWGLWYTHRFSIDGYRLDAVKSIDALFFPDWLYAMRSRAGAGAFAVGEYWSGNPDELESYLADSKSCMRLFDVPLHYHLYDCSQSGGQYDVRTLFSGTLCEKRPDLAVAFVDNHDTQPGQALESWIMDWFKTSAYACILLYKPQIPCVFLGDYEGVKKTGSQPVVMLEEMMWIRAHLLGDSILDLYDEDPHKACWLVRGVHPVLVLFTITDAKQKEICLPELAGLLFEDICRPGVLVSANKDGKAVFACSPGCCSIYILKTDAERMRKALGR